MIALLRRSIPALAPALALTAATAIAVAQDSQYHGVSHPPANDVITTSDTENPADKPAAGKPFDAQGAATEAVQQAAPVRSYYAMPSRSTAMPAQSQFQAEQTPAPVAAAPALPPSSYRASNDGTDGGIVRVAQTSTSAPVRANAYDPDSDIVHVRSLRPGELQEGTVVRVRLLDRLSTAMSEAGQPFHTRVATDVLQSGQVVIPAGAEIDGRVAEVSSGHVGGHGTMRLNPEMVTLPNGTRYRLHAEVISAPGTGARVKGEGIIQPGSRIKRDSIEYGGAVGAGAVTGAIVAGPVGALTGSLIGAGAITVHLLVDHPQATLESGTTLMFTLTQSLYLAPETMSGN